MADSAARWKRLRPDMPMIEMEDVGHLLPMEAPKLVATHMQNFIESLAD